MSKRESLLDFYFDKRKRSWHFTVICRNVWNLSTKLLETFFFFFLSLIFHTCRSKIARTYAIALFLNLYYFTLAPRWFSDFLFYRRTINEIALFLRRDKTEKLKTGERFNLRIADLSFGNNRFFLDPSNFFFKYKTILLSESLSFRKNFGGVNKFALQEK